MKSKKNLIIGIISAVSILTVVTTVLLLNNNNKGGRYDKPYIPEGFEHTEGTVDEGYVIKHTATGNEFVWVPVNNDTVKFKSYGGDEFYLSEEDDGLGDSVEKYGGFYIARYEAGCETSDNRYEGASQELDALSKPNLCVYNWITRPNAIARAREMATKQGFKGVQTRIMSEKSLNTTMQWLDTCGVDVKNPHREYGNFGNSSRVSLEKTASNEEWRQGNIYDLAGNAGEWLTDIYLGGWDYEKYHAYIYHSGLNKYTSYGSLMGDAQTVDDEEAEQYVGFRVVLYK